MPPSTILGSRTVARMQRSAGPPQPRPRDRYPLHPVRSPGSGLTPERLAGLLRASEDSDAAPI